MHMHMHMHNCPTLLTTAISIQNVTHCPLSAETNYEHVNVYICRDEWHMCAHDTSECHGDF